MHFFKATAAVAALLYLGTGFAVAQPSSFQNSCDNIKVVATHDHVWITADCRDIQGGYHAARIEVGGIHNMPKGLEKDARPQSSYQRSCSQSSLTWNRQGVTLHALCLDGKGGQRNDSIAVTDIHNNNGRLVPHM